MLIHFIAPNASFLGHLCGIAAGLLYLQGISCVILCASIAHSHQNKQSNALFWMFIYAVPRIRSPMSRLYNRAQIQSRALNRGEGYRANNSMNNTRHPQARIARTSAGTYFFYLYISDLQVARKMMRIITIRALKSLYMLS